MAVKEEVFYRGQTNEASNSSSCGGRDTGLDASYKVSSDQRSGKCRRCQTFLVQRCCSLQAPNIRDEGVP